MKPLAPLTLVALLCSTLWACSPGAGETGAERERGLVLGFSPIVRFTRENAAAGLPKRAY